MPTTTKVRPVVVASIVLICVATPIVAMKLWVRARILRRMGWDDALIVVSWTLATCLLAMILAMTRLGERSKDAPPGEATAYLRETIAASLLYIWGLVTAKASFAAMYMSLFIDRFSRRLNRFLVAFLVAEGIEETLVITLQCDPVRKAWDPLVPGWCINLIAFYRAAFAIKNFTNILLFVQPIPSVVRLHMPRAERAILCMMLSLGVLVLIVTVLRLTWLNRNPHDSTYLLVNSLVWSEVEIYVLVICSCLPSLRVLLKRLPALGRALGLSAATGSAPGRPSAEAGARRASPPPPAGPATGAAARARGLAPSSAAAGPRPSVVEGIFLASPGLVPRPGGGVTLHMGPRAGDEQAEAGRGDARGTRRRSA